MAQSTKVTLIHIAMTLYILVVGIAAGYVLASGLVHGGNVIWTLFGAVVAAMAAKGLWMVDQSAIPHDGGSSPSALLLASDRARRAAVRRSPWR